MNIYRGKRANVTEIKCPLDEILLRTGILNISLNGHGCFFMAE
jgi:hypothetical protein